ncbi:MAG: XRE family transcriptional regulator [Proteobacteria bacterium]|nr:MAG: XRE family transcriptional regulator [Pseudomonadota bacterium]
MESVILSHFDDLRRKKAFEEKRNLPLRTIAEETGLALTTLNRVSKSSGDIQNVRLSTINTLCNYFKVSVGELIEHRAD